MLLNSFFFGQGTTLPVTFVFVGWFCRVTILALFRLLLCVPCQTLLFCFSLLLFSFLFLSLPSFLDRYSTSCVFPHVIRLFLNFKVKLRIVTWRVFRIYKSVPIVGKPLLD
jgi:hypothetical protein